MPRITVDENVILPPYQPILHDNGEHVIEFMYGGRDSAKSYTTAQLLILECLQMKYFRCALIRDQLCDIRDSQWQLIKDICYGWGIGHLFTFTKSPLEIVCRHNGNKFIARGCDEPLHLKSITACNRAWIEEGVKKRESFTVILTTLRSNDSPVRIFYTFNPECEGNYENFWLYQDWFADWWSPGRLNYDGARTFAVQVAGVKKTVALRYRVTHTTYHSNPYVSDERIAFHENNKGYYYTVYTQGMWGYKVTGGEFWTQFKPAKHTADLALLQAPIHVAVDNNLNPYVSIAIWQVDLDAQLLRQYDELPCYSPDNSASKAARRLIGWMRRVDYHNVIYLYGDSSANAGTTVDDNNASFFEKFVGVLEDEGYHVVNRIGRSNPRVQLSGEFINDVLEHGMDGWNIVINKRCAVSIEDYTMAKKDKDGTILKKRITNKETGQSYEQYGHYSDTMRYLCCTILQDEYETFTNRGRRGVRYS